MMGTMFGMGFLGFGGLLFLAALVFVVVWVSRAGSSASRDGSQPPNTEYPEEILKRRYARGEIDRDEYQQRLQDLHS